MISYFNKTTLIQFENTKPRGLKLRCGSCQCVQTVGLLFYTRSNKTPCEKVITCPRSNAVYCPCAVIGQKCVVRQPMTLLCFVTVRLFCPLWCGVEEWGEGAPKQD